MAATDKFKQELVEVLDNVGQSFCRECIDAASPSCVHNNPDEIAQRLRSILSLGLLSSSQDATGKPGPVFYHLEDSRSNQPLEATQLDGEDFAKFEAVQSLAAELQLNVYLAHLQRKDQRMWVSPSEEFHSEEDESDKESTTELADFRKGTTSNEDLETEWTVNILYAGTNAIELPLDETSIVQGPDFFELEDPDEEDYDRCIGETFGGLPTRRYRALALAIIPQDVIAPFFSKAFEGDQNVDAISMLDHFVSMCFTSTTKDKSFESLRKLCSRWTTRNAGVSDVSNDEPWIVIQDLSLPGYLALNLMTLAVQYENQHLFDSVCAGLREEPNNNFLAQISNIIQGSTLDLDMLRQPLIRIITSSSDLGQRYISVIKLCNEGNICGPLQQFSIEALDESAKRCELEPVMEQDGDTLVLIAQHYRGFEWLGQMAIPLLNKKRSDTAFSIGFIWKLYLCACEGIFPGTEAFHLVKTTVAATLETFHVSQVISLSYWQSEFLRRESLRAQLGSGEIQSLPHLPAPATVATFTNLAHVVIELGMESELKIFAESLTTQSQLISELELYTLYIPFLCVLVSQLVRLSTTSFYEPSYQRLYLGMIETYWQKHAHAKPKVHWGLKSKEIKSRCSCQLCSTLDGFLADRDKTKHTMSNHATTGGNDHLISALRSLGGCISFCDDKQAGKVHITKRTSDYHQETKEWVARSEHVRAMLQGVNQQHLAMLLGSRYQSLAGMPSLAKSGTAPLSMVHDIPNKPLQSSTGNSLPGHTSHGVSDQKILASTPSRVPLAPVSQNSQPVTGIKRKFDGHTEPVRNFSSQAENLQVI